MSCFAVLYWSGFHPVAKSEGLHPDIQDKFALFYNLRKVDSHVREFAALLALGPIKASEIGLGVLGRKLLQNDSEINNEVVWLFILNVGVKTLSFTDGMKPDQYRTAKHH